MLQTLPMLDPLAAFVDIGSEHMHVSVGGNRPEVFGTVTSQLHALRDWLPLNEGADLAAQLPGLLRGAYYEQWRPATTPVKKRSKADFIARVEEAFRTDPLAHPSQDGHAGRRTAAVIEENVGHGAIHKERFALDQLRIRIGIQRGQPSQHPT